MRCAVCSHPDRAAIDAVLLQGELSLRTIAARYGLSASTLYRHRSRHLEKPTVGDLLAPDFVVRKWTRWDGTRWLPCPTPDPEDLIELTCRHGKYLSGAKIFPDGSLVSIIRRTYRLRKSKRRHSSGRGARPAGAAVRNRAPVPRETLSAPLRARQRPWWPAGAVEPAPPQW